MGGEKIRLFLGIFIPIFFSAPAAFSSISLFYSTQEMTMSSDEIIIGRVTRIMSTWEKGGKRIYSYIEIEVAETLKGENTDMVVIRQPGGEVEGIGQQIDGLSTFEPGEEVLVFLREDGVGDLTVMGMSQGKYRISTDGKTGQRIASRDLERLDLLFKEGYFTRGQEVGLGDEFPLEDLIRTIREVLGDSEF